MKNLILVFTLVIIGLTSCKKDLIEKATTSGNTSKVNQFKEIKTSESFDWKTTKEITMNIRGFKTLTPISRTLLVSTVDNKIVFHQSIQSMDQNGLIKLTIPAHIKEIKVAYGSLQKTFTTSETSIQFDYLTPISE